MCLKSRLSALWILCLVVVLPAGAQDYRPDVYEFNGSNMLDFDPSIMFEMASGGTIEFWVATGWQTPPDYDPALIVNAGPKGAHFLIAILRDRSGLAIVSGEDEDVALFDFSDGQFHHVAIRFFPDDGLDVMVDGRFVASSELTAGMLPSAGLWLGSIDGEGHPFRGAIAGLRFWGEPLTQQTLVDFSMKDVFESEHPQLQELLVISNFASGELLLSE